MKKREASLPGARTELGVNHRFVSSCGSFGQGGAELIVSMSLKGDNRSVSVVFTVPEVSTRASTARL
jgi:hypothetical protein